MSPAFLGSSELVSCRDFGFCLRHFLKSSGMFSHVVYVLSLFMLLFNFEKGFLTELEVYQSDWPLSPCDLPLSTFNTGLTQIHAATLDLYVGVGDPISCPCVCLLSYLPSSVSENNNLTSQKENYNYKFK